MPILVINPIPGQEEENAEFLEESRLAIWVKKDEEFESFLINILKDENLKKFKENIKKYSKENVAERICKNILG